MAKKVAEKDISKSGSGDKEDSVPVAEKNTEITAPEISSPAPGPGPDIPVQADRILRTFSRYPELYIDFQGGTYTVDTPPAFRSNATLYKNPYHKP